MQIGAVILAAGYSSRMGQLKALLPLGGETLLQRAVRIFNAAGVNDLVVVTGYEQERIRDAIGSAAVRCVFNPAYDQEMLVSVKTGVASLDSRTEAFYVLPVDTPLQSADILLEMNRTLAQAGAGSVIYPCYKGRRGHPPLIGAAYVAGLLQWNQPGGLKAFLSQYQEQALAVDIGDPYVLYDIDTPEQYRLLEEDFTGKTIHSSEGVN